MPVAQPVVSKLQNVGLHVVAVHVSQNLGSLVAGVPHEQNALPLGLHGEDQRAVVEDVQRPGQIAVQRIENLHLGVADEELLPGVRLDDLAVGRARGAQRGGVLVGSRIEIAIGVREIGNHLLQHHLLAVFRQEGCHALAVVAVIVRDDPCGDRDFALRHQCAQVGIEPVGAGVEAAVDENQRAVGQLHHIGHSVSGIAARRHAQPHHRELGGHAVLRGVDVLLLQPNKGGPFFHGDAGRALIGVKAGVNHIIVVVVGGKAVLTDGIAGVVLVAQRLELGEIPVVFLHVGPANDGQRGVVPLWDGLYQPRAVVHRQVIGRLVKGFGDVQIGGKGDSARVVGVLLDLLNQLGDGAVQRVLRISGHHELVARKPHRPVAVSDGLHHRVALGRTDVPDQNLQNVRVVLRAVLHCLHGGHAAVRALFDRVIEIGDALLNGCTAFLGVNNAVVDLPVFGQHAIPGSRLLRFLRRLLRPCRPGERPGGALLLGPAACQRHKAEQQAEQYRQ